MWWFWLWIVFVVVLFLLPLGYGWGYRGWGPPFPSFYRKRKIPSREGSPERELNGGWGWGADFVWLALVIAVLWILLTFVWLG